MSSCTCINPNYVRMFSYPVLDIALIKNNALVGSAIACALATLRNRGGTGGSGSYTSYTTKPQTSQMKSTSPSSHANTAQSQASSQNSASHYVESRSGERGRVVGVISVFP